MISELHLKNFRGFEDQVIPFEPLTIVVGRNNAGKSTIVEALRLISIVVSRFKGDLTNIPPRWEFPKSPKGQQPFKNVDINLQSIFHRYGDPPARVQATFTSGEVIEITIWPDNIVARRSRTKQQGISHSKLSRVSILPQVAPVAREERILNEDYVRGALSSALAPLHFRNQLHFLRDYFPSFKDAAEKTWPGLRIRGLETMGGLPDPIFLSLLIEDQHFSAEIAWMGHGLQMWLQTIWFLSRTKDHETVILDEPDVYMHADLQRRLVRFVRNRHQQVIIATHSSEIMAEVLPDNILVIDRSRKHCGFASSLPAVQKILSGLGSVHNLQLSRLWTARRFLIVEGKDVILLKQFQNTLFPETSIPIDTIPATSVGGWGGWNLAVGSEILLKNAGGDGIISYCIFDSDYHSVGAIKTRCAEAEERGISLHIWHRKELENYLLVPSTIQRVVQLQLSVNAKGPDIGEVENELEKIASKLKQEVIDCIATHIQNAERKISVATANQRAREIVSKRWKTQEGRISIISGKEAFTRMCDWVQKKYKISISALSVAYNMTAGEIPDEVKQVLSAIEEAEQFKE